MENLIFFAAPEGKFISQEEMVNLVSAEFAPFGVFPVRTIVGKAVYPKAADGGENGLVACFRRDKKIHSLPAFKPRLRPGTYAPVLDEAFAENFTFRAMVDYNPDNTLERVVELWQRTARDLYNREKIWVSALFFQRNTNIYIAGYAHPELSADVSAWKQLVHKIIRRINLSGDVFITRPIFYDLERVFNS